MSLFSLDLRLTSGAHVKVSALGLPPSASASGSNPPKSLVVLLHGFPLDASMWQTQISPLIDAGHVPCAFNIPGFGVWPQDAGPPPILPNYSMDQLADLTASVIRAYSVKSAFVCGLSLGGYVAFAFARLFPSMLKGLLLIDTRAIPDSPEVAAGRKATARTVIETRSCATLIDGMMNRLVAPQNITPAIQDSLRGMCSRTKPEAVSGVLIGMAERPSSIPTLPSIACPCLVIVGESDVISTVSEMKEFSKQLKNLADFVIIPGSGHMTPMERPKEVSNHILTFLKKYASS